MIFHLLLVSTGTALIQIMYIGGVTTYPISMVYSVSAFSE